MSRLIAFTGPAGSGKSTAADALVEEGWVRVKFADPLKNMMRAFYKSCGLEDSDYIEARIEGAFKEEPDPFLKGRTPRHAMQTLGTEWGRNAIHPNIWVEAWGQRVVNMFDRGLDVVVDDCRFPNEAHAVRCLGGEIVEIVGRDKGLGKKHQSENGVGEPDVTITNRVSLEQFQQDVVYVFSRIGFPDPSELDESA
jgi:hypothetical protein